MDGLGMTTGLRIEVLIAFAVAVGFFIIVGLSTGLYNHVQRRRGRPGLFAYSPTVRAYRPNRRNQRPKGLCEAEIQVLCPEIEYRGAENQPVLVSTGSNEKMKTGPDKDGQIAITIPSEVARTVHGSSSSAAPYSALSWETVKESIPFMYTKSKEESEYLEGDKLPDTKEFFLGRHLIPDEVCAVCLDTVELGVYLRLLPCGHAFHSSCITHWLASANRCPLCNEPPLKRAAASGELLTTGDQSVNRSAPLSSITASPNETTNGSTLYQTSQQAFDDIKLSLARRYLERERKERESRDVEKESCKQVT
ncbi:hypothetical protein GpartN1_g6151.t1 [Galdieria partita]|uniref:RING-type domain-containing protein n=1 Tax=Galdieria partita TaxID=83374 RepID=A0A9C7Q1L3_9RHOD|nr:hypothetical protein GpartN1_g6151.t1 [Galdieria partita]